MRATAGGLVRTRLLGMAGAYGVGYRTGQRADALRPAALDAHARTVSVWAKTAEERQVYAWARRQRAFGLRALLPCGDPGGRRVRQDGYTLCDPNGSGQGYHLAARCRVVGGAPAG